jgi:hypothetical protein
LEEHAREGLKKCCSLVTPSRLIAFASSYTGESICPQEPISALDFLRALAMGLVPMESIGLVGKDFPSAADSIGYNGYKGIWALMGIEPFGIKWIHDGYCRQRVRNQA